MLLLISLYALTNISLSAIQIVGTPISQVGNNTQVANSFVINSRGNGISIINGNRAIVYKTNVSGSVGNGIWASYTSKFTTVLSSRIANNGNAG